MGSDSYIIFVMVSEPDTGALWAVSCNDIDLAWEIYGWVEGAGERFVPQMVAERSLKAFSERWGDDWVVVEAVGG